MLALKPAGRFYKEAALVPNVEGADRKHSVSLAGDEMKLVSTSAAGLRTEAVYRRAK
jgi:hypothetical protein